LSLHDALPIFPIARDGCPARRLCSQSRRLKHNERADDPSCSGWCSAGARSASRHQALWRADRGRRSEYGCLPEPDRERDRPQRRGKPTFFNCISGFYTPEEGEILFRGRPIQGLRPDQITALGIARTYQNIHLFAGMTALENVLVGIHSNLRATPLGAMLNMPLTQQEEEAALVKAYELLHFVDLDANADTLATNLAYGNQRRLEIARALASDPHLLLLDEPTAGMNPQETDETMNFIRRLRDERDLTILLIEHDMHLVMSI